MTVVGGYHAGESSRMSEGMRQSYREQGAELTGCLYRTQDVVVVCVFRGHDDLTSGTQLADAELVGAELVGGLVFSFLEQSMVL